MTQVLWDKTKHVLALIMDFFCSGISGRAHWDMAPRAHLESARGLLIYVPRTHTSMIPDLKGLHLTIDSWQPNRDEDGWRQTSGHFEPKTDNGVVKAVAAPVLVQAVPWLGQDLRALGELTDSAVAPRVQVCPTAMAAAGFIFGDASGMGFGQSLWLMGRPDVNVFLGSGMGRHLATPPNGDEFYNQVLAVERGIEHGTIPAGTEIFLFTDNFVTEWAFHWATSSNKTLLLGQRSRGVLPSMSMMERYSDARANVGYQIWCSLGL
ncbi:MAG: hypothetical protein MZW92_72495 [Comamonadaceae bacterium]|nr:hypothetical protein [Comamonadaceae bacterium]